jgi:hypothetical protein
MEIVHDWQTCNRAQDFIANFAQNAFPFLKTTHFRTCSSIVLSTQNNFFDFQALTERAKKQPITEQYVAFIQGFRAALFYI